jgi:hypothetical protein
MPTLSEVKNCLGIKPNDNSTRFAIEITILNQSPYNANVLGFRNTEDSGNTGAQYPYLLNNDGNEDQGAYQTARGDVFKIMLTNYVYMNNEYCYGAQFISRIQ